MAELEISGCTCLGHPGNSGKPAVKAFGVTVGLYRVPLRAKDGTRNGLDLTSLTLGQDLLNAINHDDPTKRWYPYQELKEITYEEADPLTQTLANGENFITQKGIKKVSYASFGVTEQYFNKTSTMCVEEGLVLIDNCGNIKGQLEGTDFYPRPVNNLSYFAKFMNATDTVKSHIMYTVDYSILTNDGDQWMIGFANFNDVVGLNPARLLGMIDVRFSIVSVDSSTQVTVDGMFDFGDAVAPKAWVGALPADFFLTNKTTPAVIIPTVADPDPIVDGRYQLTFTLQPATNLIDVDALRAATGNGLNGFEGIATEFEAIA
jgi:hypothetical protein